MPNKKETRIYSGFFYFYLCYQLVTHMLRNGNYADLACHYDRVPGFSIFLPFWHAILAGPGATCQYLAAPGEKLLT